jgi:hypothetical protein
MVERPHFRQRAREPSLVTIVKQTTGNNPSVNVLLQCSVNFKLSANVSLDSLLFGQ